MGMVLVSYISSLPLKVETVLWVVEYVLRVVEEVLRVVGRDGVVVEEHLGVVDHIERANVVCCPVSYAFAFETYRVGLVDEPALGPFLDIDLVLVSVGDWVVFCCCF